MKEVGALAEAEIVLVAPCTAGTSRRCSAAAETLRSVGSYDQLIHL